jgi:CheY-like chemotaxis protein
VRDFLKTSLEIFFKIPENRIITADTAEKVIAMLNDLKTRGKRPRLVVIDAAMPGLSGYEIVNELYYRNFNADVVLLDDTASQRVRPASYMGDRDIVPGKPLVRAVLPKPFHSDSLLDALHGLGITGPVK